MSGLNFIAAFMLPLIFILPYMNAVWGVNFYWLKAIKSSSSITKVASTFKPSTLPSWIDPDPSFKLIVQVYG